MIEAKGKVEFDANAVMKPAERAAFTNLSKAAFEIRKTAQASIVRGKLPSQPGSPPTSRRGNLQRAILYNVEKAPSIWTGNMVDVTAVIGPRGSVVGESASAHEFGGLYKDQEYPARPFMAPSMLTNLDRFAGFFRDSIGSNS